MLTLIISVGERPQGEQAEFSLIMTRSIFVIYIDIK